LQEGKAWLNLLLSPTVPSIIGRRSAEISGGARAMFAQFDRGGATEQLFGNGDIESALSRIVFGQGPRDGLRFRAGDREDTFR
jgi:hypothetical protein